MREENRILKKQIIYVMNLICSYNFNSLEQKSLENFIEIVGVPKINNEDDCRITVKKCLHL